MSMSIDYENPWLYQNTNFTSDDIDDKFGFVYCITNNKTADNTSAVNTSGSLEPQKVKNGK